MYSTIIGDFYKAQTRRNPECAPHRLALIEQILVDRGIEVDDDLDCHVRIEMHKDNRWNMRRNRTKAERCSIMIGYANSLGDDLLERWWLVPLWWCPQCKRPVAMESQWQAAGLIEICIECGATVG